MANQPTIVVANLDDAKLKASIDKMVNDLNAGLNRMTTSTDAAVTKMQTSLQSVGNIKFGSNGDSSKQVQENNKVTQSVNNMTAAYDSFLSVLQKSGRTESGFIKNFNAQDLATLKFALRDLEAEYTKINREGGGLATEKRSAELREQIVQVGRFVETYEKAFNAMSKVERSQSTSAAAQKFAKEWTDNIDKVDYRLIQLRKYFSDLEKMSTREIRVAFANALKMPSGNIDEIADKLMALQIIMQHLHGTEILSPNQIANGNKQINELVHLLETQLSLQKSINSQSEREPAFLDAIKQYREGLRAAAAEAKAFISANPMMGKYLYSDQSNITGKAYTGIIYAENDARAKGLTIEEQILQVVKQKHEAEKMYLSTQQQVTSQIQQQVQTQQQGVNTNVKKTFAEYEDLRSAIAAVLQLEQHEVTLSESQNASYKALSLTLKQLTSAYESLGAESRKSENAGALLASLQEVQRVMQQIRSEMSRPTSLQNALGLPETTIDDITYKIKMLRAYAQGVNTETSNGQSEITKISDTIDVLSEKVKNLQKTTKQTASDTNSKAFETIAKQQEETVGQVGAKIKVLKSHLDDLRKQPVLDDKAIKRAEDALEKLYKKSQKLNDIKPTRTNVNKALKMSEKSLDEIAQKIQRLSSIRMYLNVGSQKAEIEDINKALERLRQEQSKILGQNKDMLASNNALVRSFNYMKNRLAFYFTIGASTQFVKSLIDIRSQYEMNERALGILINSAERGTQIFKELSDMALVSPYTLIELSNAAKQLTAYDIAAKDVVDTTRRLADMASAVGIPMERLTYALGQIKAYGYLNSRDARMFANAGIPLVKQLADYYTQLEGKMVSTADIYDRMKKKAIDYNDVMAVVTKMTDEGGKFFDFQAKMAETLKVRLANLTLAWNNMMNEIGESQQGLLTGTIGTLKELFLHWRDINQILHNLIYSFGLLKVGQIAYLAWVKKAGLGLAAMEVAGRRLTNIVYSLGAAMKTLITNPLTWIFVAISAGVSMLQTWSRNKEEIEKLNKAIADGAKESAEALEKMLQEANMIEARTAAGLGKLSNAEGMKVWEKMREQIELSSLSAKDIIPSLLYIPDINKRVTDSFNLAERIADANNKLSDLEDKLDMSQDTILNGLFGEGLIEDIEDYSEHMSILADNAKFAEKTNRGFWESLGNLVRNVGHGLTETLGSSTEEAEREIRKFATNAADVIKEELGEEGIKDNVQVGEAVARVIKEIEKQYPQIKGAGKKLFESIFNDVMAGEFKGVFSKTAYYQNVFLEQLKKDYGSTFRGITDSIIDESHKWSKEQQTAIDKTVAKMKKDMPESAQRTINKIVSMLNTTEFKLKFVAEFSTSSSDFQKEFLDRIKKLGVVREAALKIYAPQTTEELPAWTKKQQDAIAALREENKNYEKDSSAFAKRKIAANKAEIANRTEALSLFNQSVLKDKELNKLQRAAETELQKALKEELQLIEKVRSAYKTLTKEGMNHLDAITTATSDYEESVTNVNNVLKRYGLELDLSKFAGIENPHGLVVMLQKQLDTLFGKAKPAEIQALQVKIKDIKVDAAAFDQKTFATSLNDQLGKLKDEYELAIALDADPELGESFASLIGLDLDSLPRTVSEYAKRATDYLNEYMDKNKTGIQLPSVELTNQQLKDLKDMVDTNVLNAEVYERIKKVVNEIREARKKEMEEHIRDWNKLIEKYSEYETKIKNIQNTTAKERRELVRTFGNEAQQATAVQLETQIRAENDPAAKQALIKQLGDLANQVSQGNPVAVKLNVAIDNKGREELAKASFEEFQKTPEWLLATGDLAYMTRDAIGYLIDKINDYKKTAKYLDPKQIKQMNNALKSLYKEQRKNNPFEVLIQAIDQAKENAALFDDKINDTKDKIKETEKEIAQAQKYGYDTTQLEEQLSVLQKALEELEKAKGSFGKVDPEALAEGFTALISVAHQVSGAFTDMMKALGGKNGGGDAEAIGQMFSILEKTGSYAAMGAKLGGTYGAIIGGVIGAASSVVSMFAEQFSGNADITDAVKRSERAVKRLELSYIDLKHAMDEAYGTAEIGAQRAIIVNKELQLAELKRQLQLEQSRKAKYRDEDRILELRKQIRELEYDIVDSINGITNSLLGISSVGNAAETLVTNMIAAFKKGEQFMDEYKQTFDDMIDNMIMKAIVSNVIGNRLQEMFDRIQQTARERAKKEEEAYASAYKEFESSSKWADKLGEYAEFYNFDPYADKVFGDKNKLISREEWDELWKKRLEFLKKQYEAAMTPTPDDVQGVRDDMKNWRDSVKEEFMAYMDAFGIKYGQDSTKNLSALQQGISQISEVTAQSLEAYANSISQQAYLRNDLLIQIRDVILGFDVDIQTDTLGQILLQLRSSYEIQSAIHSLLSGWSADNERAVRVELLS